MLAVTRGAGVPDRDAASVGFLIPLYVVGFALDQDAGPLPLERLYRSKRCGASPEGVGSPP